MAAVEFARRVPGRAAAPFRLVPGEAAGGPAPRLDPAQQEVVRHRGGPLLVLAGPGTGKTTTLVEAVLDRTRGPDAVAPDEILVLTFSRAAAAELRDRISARLAADPQVSAHALAASAPTATTFHSFCFALVGLHQDPELFSDPLRLLSGPEQDVVIRELVKGTVEPGGWGAGPGGWPQALRAALGTRGFAQELRAVLLRARDLGLDPLDLEGFARRAERADWFAAARFFGEYLDVADARGVLDYSELVHRAVLLIETPEVQAQMRERYRAVFVDEYQDTDPAQVRLLKALAGDGRDLVVVGDPDQSIYAFRGADLGGILNFPREFPRRDGSDAPIAVLQASRRAGPTVLEASRQVARRMSIPRLPAERVRAHRALQSVGEAARTPGVVEAAVYPSPNAEHAAVADVLRRAHLEDGIPWDEMAVLVRAGDQLAPVRRALLAGNVPSEVVGNDVPLAQEPAVAALLHALRCAADPAALTPDAARELLTGPLGGLDGSDLRRLGRALRAEEAAALAAAASAQTEGGDGDGDEIVARPVPVVRPRPTEHLIRDAVSDPRLLVPIDSKIGASALTVARILESARRCLEEGGAVEDALWILWHGDDRARPPVRTGWPERLRRAVERSGAQGRMADRDLDAVIALFALAARAQERSGHAGATDFISGLLAQAIAADTLADKAARGGAVQIMTAHRSKGLQWRLVVVSGVQEGLWPDLRRRGSLLEPDRIGRAGLTDPLSPAALLAEERRLFYVAVTRARERLLVTAVESDDDDGDAPSRFLRELGVEVRQAAAVRKRPLDLSALIAELRRTATDPAASPQLRAAAVQRLAKAASATDADGRRLVPSADPSRWWGLFDFTDNDEPVTAPDRPVALSASSVAGLDACALRWFLDRRAAAAEQSTEAQGVGMVFHALAEDVANRVLAADIDVLMGRLDEVWDSLPFEAPWKSEQERRAARRALERFLLWHDGRGDGRSVSAVEVPFDETLTVGGVAVRLHGRIDRIEIDAEGQAYLVDFKTGKNPKTAAQVAKDPQLSVYQLAVRAGAVHGEEPVQAELVYPADRSESPMPTVLVQPALSAQPDPERAEKLVADVARRVLEERFFATGDAAECRMCHLRKACPRRAEGRELPQ